MLNSLLFALASLGLSGCACFPSEELPRLSADEVLAGNRMHAVGYECTYETAATLLEKDGFPAPDCERLFCSAFVDAYPEQDPTGLHVDLRLRMIPTRYGAGMFLWMGFLTVCSLGIFPAYSEIEPTLLVKVSYAGEQVREYSYSDRATYWTTVLFFPCASAKWREEHDPVKFQVAVFDNLLLYFLRDLQRDLPQILDAAPADPKRATVSGPGSGRVPASGTQATSSRE